MTLHWQFTTTLFTVFSVASGVTSTNCQDDTTRAIYNYTVYDIECCPIVARPLYVKMTLRDIISDLFEVHDYFMV